jgi:hypothetical protein
VVRKSNAGDFYPTPARTSRALVDFWRARWPEPDSVLDPCAGLGCLLSSWVEGGHPHQGLFGYEIRPELVAESDRAWPDLHKGKPTPVELGDGLAYLDESERIGDNRPQPARSEEARLMVVLNPPFADADRWVASAVAAQPRWGSSLAILLRSQWLDDGNTRGRWRYRSIARHDPAEYVTRPPCAILRIPWRISFDGRGANACAYAWHIWTPYARESDGVLTYWAQHRDKLEISPRADQLWRIASEISGNEHRGQ